MIDCNAAATPLDSNQNLTMSMCPNNEDENHEMAKAPYIQATTYPDISFAMNIVSHFSTNHGKMH